MEQSLEDNIEQCTKSLLENFLKWPYNFFTESDAHSYLYYYFRRFGLRALKQFYLTNDSQKTILIHREYPTSFRYHKKDMRLDEQKGGRGHYDLAVLDPEFVKTHKLKQVIAQNYKDVVRERLPHLLTTIEFKLIVRPLAKNLKLEIYKDLEKLKWSVQKQQAKRAYMIIFNRVREEKGFKDELREKQLPSQVRGIYCESIIKNPRHYDILYLGDWKYKLRFSKKF